MKTQFILLVVSSFGFVASLPLENSDNSLGGQIFGNDTDLIAEIFDIYKQNNFSNEHEGPVVQVRRKKRNFESRGMDYSLNDGFLLPAFDIGKRADELWDEQIGNFGMGFPEGLIGKRSVEMEDDNNGTLQDINNEENNGTEIETGDAFNNISEANETIVEEAVNGTLSNEETTEENKTTTQDNIMEGEDIDEVDDEKRNIDDADYYDDEKEEEDAEDRRKRNSQPKKKNIPFSLPLSRPKRSIKKSDECAKDEIEQKVKDKEAEKEFKELSKL